MHFCNLASKFKGEDRFHHFKPAIVEILHSFDCPTHVLAQHTRELHRIDTASIFRNKCWIVDRREKAVNSRG